MNDRPDQSWRLEPSGKVEVFQGENVMLRCEVNNQRGTVSWVKKGVNLFVNNRDRDEGNKRTNLEMEGDPSLGEHNLKVKNASADDAGEYRCQVSPEVLEKSAELFSKVELVVLPSTPAPTPSTPLASSQDNSSSSSSHIGADSSLQTSYLTSQPRARDTQGSLTRLPGDQAPSNSLQVSTSALHSGSSVSSAGGAGSTNLVSHHYHAPLLGALAGWPTMLLMLATVLLALNVYLVVSLVKRHRRNRKGRLAASGAPPAGRAAESSPDDLGSSGGCSAGTASSGLGASDLNADFDTSGASLACTLGRATPALGSLVGECRGGMEVVTFGPPTPKGLDQADRPSSLSGSLYQLPNNNHLHSHHHQQQQQQQQHQQHQHQHQQHAFAITPLACLPPHLAAANGAPTAHAFWNGREYVAIDPNGWVLEI